MSELSRLSPQPLWNIFAHICAIPHPSYHEEELAQYVLAFASERGWWSERDAVGNILIRKPATRGMEQCKPVVLQAHLDMVPQKNSTTVHDFTQDPIIPWVDGDWVAATGTTLGADNGIGMASALAVLSDDRVRHGPLEVLLTINEESGMDGAFGLQPGWLEADILINTDSEQEGDVYMGCAGGTSIITSLPVEREEISGEYQTLKLSLSGLRGGHSGCDIHRGYGNANKLLVRFLAAHRQQLDLRLIEFAGGTLRNAIPRESWALIAIPAEHTDLLNTLINNYLSVLTNELGQVQKKLALEASVITSHQPVLSTSSLDQFLALANATPDGVIRYSDSMPGVVETSLNMGVITFNQHTAEITCLVRSFIDSARTWVTDMLVDLAMLAGASTEISGGYPGWQPDSSSEVMKLVRETYQGLFAKTPAIQAIHAGLECGIFKKPYPDIDMVSIGPTIVAPHSPDERVHIDSVSRYWQLLTAVLAAIPVKEHASQI